MMAQSGELEEVVLYAGDEDGFVVTEIRRWLSRHGIEARIAPPAFSDGNGGLEPVSLRAGQTVYRNVNSIVAVFFHSIEIGEEVPGFRAQRRA